MKRAAQSLISKHFDKNLDLHIQTFNLLGFAGMAACALVTVFSLAQQMYFNAVICFVFLWVALGLVCFTGKKIAGVNLSYRFSSLIVVIAVFVIAFPVMFFASGGYLGSMLCFFIFAIIFTTLLLSGFDRAVMLVIEFLLYIGCCVIAFYYPGFLIPALSDSFYFSDALISMIVCGLLLMVVILLQIRIYNNRQMQIKELNRELEARNDTLLKYDKMKTDFLAAVGHEISKPLTAISGSNEDTMDLLREAPVKMDEIAANHERIRNKVSLIDKIVTDLMDTAAIETGRLSLSRQQLKLPELIKLVCDAEFSKLDRNNNKILYDLEQELPALCADPERIGQVMINLLSNAVRHTRDGEITVKLTRVKNRQTVSVTDSGEGMTPEMADIALKEYMTSNAGNKYWRHGYGLFVSRQIILSHGGEIWVESKQNRGTTVSFTLLEEENE